MKTHSICSFVHTEMCSTHVWVPRMHNAIHVHTDVAKEHLHPCSRWHKHEDMTHRPAQPHVNMCECAQPCTSSHCKWKDRLCAAPVRLSPIAAEPRLRTRTRKTATADRARQPTCPAMMFGLPLNLVGARAPTADSSQVAHVSSYDVRAPSQSLTRSQHS